MLFKVIRSGSQHILSVSHQRLQRYMRDLPATAFLREWLASPKSIGAICPSSRYLARTMARQIPVSSAGLIIELGPGTGVVTQALLERGVSPDKLVLIEFSAPFVQRLRQRFPGVTVLHGNAANLSELVPRSLPVDAIVSSLPLCSLPTALTRAILDQWEHVLGVRGGVAVQFTYNMAKPGWMRFIKATAGFSTLVWANIPPARVSCFHFPARACLSSKHHDTLFQDTHPSGT